MFENRKYVVFNTSETGSINFSQIMESSVNTLRLNNSGSKTFVKYEGSQPSSVAGLSSKSNEYTHTQTRNVITGGEWKSEQI